MNALSTNDQQHYIRRFKKRQESGFENIWALLDQVKDPEIPALSLWDLGIITNIEKKDKSLIVTLTPTYSGCPAVEVMKADIESLLERNGFKSMVVNTQLSPAWSSNWISPEGREKMRKYGIAPPNRDYCASAVGAPLGVEEKVISIACPHCYSANTRQISEFGSTACKALHQCNDCMEPFDYFKSI